MKLIMKGRGKVVIDGRDFVAGDISIEGGRVTIDGVEQADRLVGDVNIEVHGDVETLENASGRVVAQSVGTIKTLSAYVKCGDVSGSIKTMSGDVTCGKVGGSVSTMSGDINHG